MEKADARRVGVRSIAWLDVSGAIILVARISLNECARKREAKISSDREANKEQPACVGAWIWRARMQTMIWAEREAIAAPEINGENENPNPAEAEDDIDAKP